ncbi:MAG: hypothetical protein IV100_35065 [Myxococcales bacterium]|nr:hypothetical protein [Myxococcales bacterium]
MSSRGLTTRVASAARLVLGLPLLLAAAEDTPIPWPSGEAPTDAALDAWVLGATEKASLDRWEAFLEAVEPGESSESLRIIQSEIDSGLYGLGDLAVLFRWGDGLFEHTFQLADGFGDRDRDRLTRVHDGERGGLDTYSCAGCHSASGPNGSGLETAHAFVHGDGVRLSSANVRSAPSLLGVGLVQALAAEMTRSLSALRDTAMSDAASTGQAVRTALVAKGVSFGAITASPDGHVDTSEVAGVDPDLVVKPFGWKGDVSRLRRFAENAARIHFGIQSQVLVATTDPARLGDGPLWFDPDDDGVFHELTEGSLTAVAVYLTLLEAPVMLPPHDPGLRERWARGSATFDAIGCGSCHRRSLTLESTYWREAPDTTGAEPVLVNLLSDGEAPRSTAIVGLFSDLRRHDLGPGLADPHGDAASHFLTRPLWGLADTAPYLHDGRAATIPDAIAAHGGEAAGPRDAFLALPHDAQVDLHVFLLSFTRAPKPRIAP